MKLSREQDTPEELARAMVIPAIEFVRGIGINVSMSRRHAVATGDCLFDSVVLSENPNLSEAERRALTRDMRRFSVGASLQQIDQLSDERLERLLDVMTNKDGRPNNKEEMRRDLNKYLKDGIYQNEGGDILPYSLSAHLNRPLIIVDMSGDRTPTTTTVFPDEIFEPVGQRGSPLMLARRGDHFNPLLVDSGEEAKVMAFLSTDRPATTPTSDTPATTPTPPATPRATTPTPPATPRAITPTPPATTTTGSESGSNFEELSLQLQGCVLGQQDTTEDEDDDELVLPNQQRYSSKRQIVHIQNGHLNCINIDIYSLSVADSPEQKEVKKGDSPVEEPHPPCYIEQSNGPRITHSSPYPKYRCETCNRWEIAQITADAFLQCGAYFELLGARVEGFLLLTFISTFQI